jgi:hypothetical protein
MFTLQLNVYTVAISSVNKIVINEWLSLNNSGFLMNAFTMETKTYQYQIETATHPPRL